MLIATYCAAFLDLRLLKYITATTTIVSIIHPSPATPMRTATVKVMLETPPLSSSV